MKVSVDISDSELKEIRFFTGEKKKGLAIRKMVADSLMLWRRAALAQKFISGEWGVKLNGYEAGKARERLAAGKHAKARRK
ncbi:MAG: hypothetical protein H7144_04455 [Burkholderiales bacterium]|nr:hypothetical protein [Phycisphaerae bacterium]